MADFLTRLAQRARGTAKTVKPVIAPVFAPLVVAEPTEPAMERPVKPQQQEIAGTPLLRRAAPQPPTVSPASFPKIPEPEPVLVPVVRTIETRRQESVRSVIVERPESPEPASPVQQTERLLVSREFTQPETTIVHQQTTVPTHAREIAVSTRPGKPPAPLTPQPQAPAQPQPVHIHIDRIEVRAIHPPTPSPVSRPTPKSAQAMPLDEYLKQRNGSGS